MLNPPKCFIYKHLGGFRRLCINPDFMENGCQNGSKNYPEIDILELGGPIFEILGGFWRMQIFDEFLICKKCAKNHKNQRLGSQKAKFSDARRNARGRWGDIGGLRTLRFEKI